MTQRLNKELKDFFERDDSSRLTKGVKDTVTRQKVKKQKRILLCSQKELHQKYLDDKKSKISYSSFCKQKPFWVAPPSERDRETCACKIHENIQFMADALHKKGVINTSNLLLLLKEKSCDIEQMSCMYGYCETCKDECFTENKIDSNMEIEWFQWVSKKENRIVRSEEKEITITMKEQTKGTVGNLLDLFTYQMVRFKIHSFNIGNQLKHYRLTKENLQENEALLHIDFAENFQTKLSREIQSMHFGASHS